MGSAGPTTNPQGICPPGGVAHCPSPPTTPPYSRPNRQSPTLALAAVGVGVIALVKARVVISLLGDNIGPLALGALAGYSYYLKEKRC